MGEREISVGSRIFWSMVLLIIIVLAWLKYVEEYVTLWGALVVWVIAAGIMNKFAK